MTGGILSIPTGPTSACNSRHHPLHNQVEVFHPLPPCRPNDSSGNRNTSLPLKIDPWKRRFLLESYWKWPFLGAVLVLGSVTAGEWYQLTIGDPVHNTPPPNFQKYRQPTMVGSFLRIPLWKGSLLKGFTRSLECVRMPKHESVRKNNMGSGKQMKPWQWRSTIFNDTCIFFHRPFSSQPCWFTRVYHGSSQSAIDLVSGRILLLQALPHTTCDALVWHRNIGYKWIHTSL